MNITSVSFGSTLSEFNEKIKAPQRYVHTETPSAATSLSKSHKKKGSFGKTVVKLALAAGAIAAALALGAKKGAFNVEKFKGETTKKIAEKLQNAGNTIADKANKYYTTAKTKVSEIAKKVTEKAPEAAEAATEAAEAVV